jgi:methylenetetrahydrofolate reductase (NADPH)
VSVDPKIIDLMKAHKGEDPWVALEYFPPRTASGVENLKAKLPRMKREATPMYVDVTWGAGGTTADATMDITIAAKRDFGLIPNMHLTCTNIEAEKVKEALETCKREGITNIVALRGDAPAGQDKWEATEGGFNCGMDLVAFIRQNYGDHFGISVAGYPEGHPDKIKTVTGGFDSLSESEKRRCSVQVADDGTETLSVCSDADFAVEMAYLKSKIDAGADFIITQMFFDVQVYADFCKECVACGINVPVVPGIMCLNAYGGFKKMGIMCKTRVPEKLTAKMEELKDDKDAIKAYGSEFGAEMSRELMAVGAPGLHYYCLNLEIVVMGILDRLNMRTPSEPAVSVDPKIIDLMKGHKGEEPWVALEYFPPRTASGVENLKVVLPQCRRMAWP